jgi:hypothetical protein
VLVLLDVLVFVLGTLLVLLGRKLLVAVSSGHLH